MKLIKFLSVPYGFLILSEDEFTALYKAWTPTEEYPIDIAELLDTAYEIDSVSKHKGLWLFATFNRCYGNAGPLGKLWRAGQYEDN